MSREAAPWGRLHQALAAQVARLGFQDSPHVTRTATGSVNSGRLGETRVDVQPTGNPLPPTGRQA